MQILERHALSIAIVGFLAAVSVMVARAIAHSDPRLRDRIRYVNRAFAQCADRDRYFVRCKLRLDRIFGLLTNEDLGSGTVVDLGCSYGIALCFAAYGETQRRLVGCDLNVPRITVARDALSSLNAEVSVQNVCQFTLPESGLILLLDVLQYLPAEQQLALLSRCCAALEPKGKLIFRVHDRERGLWSAIPIAMDRIMSSHWDDVGTRPQVLSAAQYHRVLQDAGMHVRTRRFLNRLPFAHILFIATNPLVEATQ